MHDGVPLGAANALLRRAAWPTDATPHIARRQSAAAAAADPHVAGRRAGVLQRAGRVSCNAPGVCPATRRAYAPHVVRAPCATQRDVCRCMPCAGRSMHSGPQSAAVRCCAAPPDTAPQQCAAAAACGAASSVRRAVILARTSLRTRHARPRRARQHQAAWRISADSSVRDACGIVSRCRCMLDCIAARREMVSHCAMRTQRRGTASRRFSPSAAVPRVAAVTDSAAVWRACARCAARSRQRRCATPPDTNRYYHACARLLLRRTRPLSLICHSRHLTPRRTSPRAHHAV
jgi:hypothetical protein